MSEQMTIDHPDFMTTRRMILDGSDFETALAGACRYATTDQLAAIKHALPDVFERYRPAGIQSPPEVDPPFGAHIPHPVTAAEAGA